MAQDQKGGGLRMADRVALIVVAVFVVFLAFGALHFVAGLVWWIVKAAIVVLLVWLVFRFLVGRRRS